MGLLFKLKNGETSLKSLRYGHDRPGGGDSGQPFIKKPIEKDRQPFLGAIDGDGLLRGGILAPVNAVDDVLRLTKYLFNLKNPSGLLFTLKQNVLSRVSPKTESSYGLGYLGGAINAGVYTPLSTLLQAGGGFAGVHLNLLGLDPTGKFPNASLNKYEKVAYDNNLRKNNKSPYYLPPNHLNIENQSPGNPPKKFDPIANLVPPEDITFGDYGSMTFLETSMGLDNRLLQLWETKGLNLANPITPKEVGTIRQYNGGPGSIVGIGSTRIPFATSNDGQTPLRTGVNRIDPYRKEGGGYDYSRPTVKYSTPNIYEQSVSKRYSNLVFNRPLKNELSQLSLFGENSYLESFNNFFKLQPWNTTENILISPNRYQDKYGLTVASQFGIIVPISKDETTKIIAQPPISQLTRKLFPNVKGVTTISTPQEQWISEGDGFAPLDNNRASTYDPINEFGSLYNQNTNQNNQPINTLSQDNINQKVKNSKENDEAPVINFGKSYKGGTFIPYKASDLIINPPKTSFPSIPPTQAEINQLIRNSKLGTAGAISLLNDGERNAEGYILPSPSTGYDGFIRPSQGSFNLPYRTNNDTPTVGYGSNTDPYLSKEQSKIDAHIEETFENEASNPSAQILHPSYRKTRIEELNLPDCFRPKFLVVKHEKRVHTGDPGKGRGSYSRILDKVSGNNSYNASRAHRSTSQEANDFVHFNIGIVNPRNPEGNLRYMNFRSYIDSFSDSYNSKWKDITYMGRGESFKKYDGFDRDISMAFTVVAHSQREMCGIYEKLNTLASSVAPTYTSAGYMAGNLVKMSVGGYIREQYGIITGFTYDVPEEASWELTIGAAAAIKDELPMMIKVTGLKFTPIYDFVPQYNTGMRGDKFVGGFGNRFITKLMTDCGTSCPPKKITVCNDPNATNYQKKDIGAVINDKSGNGTHKYVADNTLCKYKNDTVQFIEVCNNQLSNNNLPSNNYLKDKNGKKYSENQVKSGATIETRKNTSGNTTTITTIKLKGDRSVCKDNGVVETQFYEQARDNTATPGIPGGTQTTPGGLITPGQNSNNDVQSPVPNVYDDIIARNTKTDPSGKFSTVTPNRGQFDFRKASQADVSNEMDRRIKLQGGTNPFQY
jgi:hypothetical protein